MQVRPSNANQQILRRNLPIVAWLVLVGATAETLYQRDVLAPDVMDTSVLGLVLAALGVFLAFRVSEAYDRWWEARKLWGGIVNDSRSWGRQVTTLVVPERLPLVEDAEALQRELVLRHVAWVYALRSNLRGGGSIDAEGWRVLTPLLPAEELERLREVPNVPARLVHTQAARLAAHVRPDTADHLVWQSLDAILTRLYDLQGGCERIKNTTFPATLSMYTSVFVWMTATSIPFAMLDGSGVRDLAEAAIIVGIGWMFVKIDQLGRDLKDPFEDRLDDTPMTALGRLIERDLRSFLGQTDLPPPEQPRAGVLM